VPLATAAARESGFCCAGCSYVYRLVHEHGLEGYYKIKDAVLPPVDQVVFQPRDYAWLAELQQAAEKVEPGLRTGSKATVPELTLEVQGISCAGCVWLIEKIFHRQPGALQIETDAPLGRMRLRWAPGKFDAPAFARALQSFNYLVGPPGEEPAVAESKLLVRRVGLCAAFSMNIMLFSLPVYFGMQSTFPYAPLFGTLSLGLATLSLLTGGTYFFNRAARALRDGMMHIDLPIAVGIAGAYGGSLFGWLSGRESFVYFDFVGTFIFLMLTGRWAQVAAVERNRRRLLTAQARPHKVGVLAADGSAADQPVEALRTGDSFLVRAGQVVPVEAQLESAAATLGTAWITGEADPRECRAGARVPAGALNFGRTEIRLRAAQPWAASLLRQLLRPAERDVFRHRFLERIVSGYLTGVFLVAAGAGLAWWLGTHDAARTWSVVTAILVVSCPCAIGLAFPLTDEMATVALRRFGVFVREADVWPRLARIRKIIFDKTGTLTLETPELVNPEALAGLSPVARAALAALVRDNAHPVSQCLHENLLAGGFHPVGRFAPNALSPDSAYDVTGVIHEEPGFGVTLRSDQGLWSLGRPGWNNCSAGSPHPASNGIGAQTGGISDPALQLSPFQEVFGTPSRRGCRTRRGRALPYGFPNS
jgi:Cu2+-exporting ATPase